MKIVSLHIYGYGQLENVVLDNLSDFQVFFGENEAGKSTIMAFIHAVLFGFPTKLQTTELRYEPKHSTKYGGKIRIYHEEKGYAVIERVKGKAAGDVKVIMDNGAVGGEDLLKELIGNFDKSLFQAIFSFNLHGLQNIHQMKGEEIGKFLFSAGTLGTESLAKTEAYLQKELESRFKPSGKKPILNEKLQELNEINQDLKKALVKMKEYENLAARKEKLQQEMEEISGLLQEIQEKAEKLNEWKRIESHIKDERWIRKELEELGDIVFPARGIERLEKLNQVIQPYRAEIASIADRMENVKKEAEDLRPDQTFLEKETEVSALLDQVPLYEQLKLEKQQCETKLSEIEKRLSIIKEKLHLPIDDEDVSSINTNIYMKNQVEIVSRKKQKLEEAKEELDSRYHEEKSMLAELEKSVRITEASCLPTQERERLEEQLQLGNDKRSLELELKGLQDKIEFHQHGVQRDKAAGAKLAKQKKRQFLLFAMILACLILYGALTKQWILFSLSVAGFILLSVLMMMGNKQPEEKGAEFNLEELRKIENQIIQKLQSADYLDLKRLEEQLMQDRQRREQLQMLSFKLKQEQIQYQKVLAKMDEWETETSENQEKLLSISRELKIPEYIADSFLLEAFQFIEQYKAADREKHQILGRLEQINGLQGKILEGLQSFERDFLTEKGLDLHKTAHTLRTKLKKELEKHIMCQERMRKAAELEAERKQKTLELEHIQEEYAKLLDEAKVETPEQFYELGGKAEKQGKLLERLDRILSQLQYTILSKEEQERFLQIHNSEELIEEGNRSAKFFQEKVKKLQEEQAEIKYQIQVLEEGGVYSDILHHFKQKKFELEEASKEWAVYSLAQNILSSTIERYKNVHLPKMLARAEEYLVFLTNGSYGRIHLDPKGPGFLVERKDHTLFEANELSQATTEQLYAAIRLALATTLYEKYPFPIIIDDSFVNFDAARTKKVIEMLKRLERNQVLFFTCHAHLLQLFEKENILRLEKGAVQII